MYNSICKPFKKKISSGKRFSFFFFFITRKKVTYEGNKKVQKVCK